MGECAAAAAKTSVWWDIDRCAVPPGGCDPHRIAHNVIAALAASAYTGPVSIVAYGDAARIAPGVLEALSATGISFNHVPAGAKDGVDKKMLVDMLFWAFDNPPPGNYLLISGDQDFSGLLHRLRMKKYGILLAQPLNASSQAIANAAKTVWLWESLAAGEPLLAEPPHSLSVSHCNRDSNNSDTSKCSQSKVRSEYSKCDGNVKSGNQYQAKPLQKYVQKTNIASSSAGNQDRVESVEGASDSSIGSTASELDRSSVSSSSSSLSMERTKVDQINLLGTPTMSQPSAQKPVVFTHSQQVGTSHKFIVGEKPSTSTECMSRNGTLDFSVSNGHYHQMYQQSQSPEAQNKLHSEYNMGDTNGKAGNERKVKPLQYNMGDTNGKAGNERKVKPLQKYVKKTNIASRSASNRVDSVRVYDCSIGSTTSGLDLSSVLLPSNSESLEGAKVDHASPLGTSTLSQPSARKHVVSTHFHQVRAPHEFILGKKPSTSTEHASRDGTHDFGVSIGHFHLTYQQTQSSQAQNKLHSNYNMGDNNGKAGNQYKVKQHQGYVKKTNFSSSSACNEIDLVNGIPSNLKGSILSHPSQSMSSSSSSESLDGAKMNQSSPPKNPAFSLSPAHKPVMPHLHQVGAEFKPSTSIECTPKNGIFHFGASSGHNDPTYQQTQSSLLPKQHNSGPHPHSAFGQFSSTNADIGSSCPPSAGHNGVLSSQIQTWPSGSTFQGLPDICADFSRLTISECPRGTGETKLPCEGAPANYPVFSMPNNSGHPRGLHEIRYSFHPGPNISFHPNHSSAPQNVQPPSSDYTCKPPGPPNQSCILQNLGNHGETQGSPPNSSEPEGTIRNIVRALDILKIDKIFPTESNIADCIRYGEMNLSGFDVKKALELAIRHQAVVMKKLVNDMPLFVAKDESLWKCVDVTNSNAKHPKETLDTVCKYISSTSGHSAIKNSQSRYQAATILKKLCLQHHALGDVLQILHIVIVRKKWLVPHSSGWQPLSFNTIVVDATTDAIEEVRS